MIDYYFIPVFLAVIGVLFFLGYFLKDYLFVILAGFLLMILGVYVVINGVDYVDPDDVSLDDLGLYYGEMWNYTANLSSWEFPLYEGSGVYHNLSNLSAGQVYGFGFDGNDSGFGGSYLTVQTAGLYKVNAVISAYATFAGLYGFGVADSFDIVNSRNCYARIDVPKNSAGVGTITCLLDLEVGDTLNLVIEDEIDPIVGDVYIQAVNLNAVRVGGSDTERINVNNFLFRTFWITLICIGGYLVLWYGIKWIQEGMN